MVCQLYSVKIISHTIITFTILGYNLEILVRFQYSPQNAGNGVIWLAHVVNLFRIETYNTTNNDEFWFPWCRFES